MSLKLGQVPAVVISSSKAAQLIFKTNDIVFGTRPKTQAYDYLSYGFKGTAFAEYGPYWRHVKKLCTVQLLSAPKVDLFAPLRREELCLVVKSLQKASVSRKIVDLSEILHNLTEDIVFKMTFGPNTNKDNAFNYKDLVQEGMLVIDGYYIEKKTMVLVNTWGLGRDPKLWSDNAESFYPERFVDNDVDVRGHHFQLIPFGSGRRRCPGMRMGLTIIKLVVAQLVHCFDWELPYEIKPEELDMTEKFGLTVPRAKHLLAIPACRLYA